jgi:hypothetical protein
MERIEPVRSDRSVTRVELTRLTPLEREQERQRREKERERRRRQEGAIPPAERPEDGRTGIDVRA